MENEESLSGEEFWSFLNQPLPKPELTVPVKQLKLLFPELFREGEDDIDWLMRFDMAATLLEQELSLTIMRGDAIMNFKETYEHFREEIGDEF